MNKNELIEYAEELEIAIEQLKDVISELKDDLENVGYDNQEWIINKLKQADFTQFKSIDDIVNYIFFINKEVQ